MICIYRAKQPAVLTDKVLPLLVSDGELTKNDIDELFDKAGIESYSQHHINLGYLIRLFEEGDEVFLLSSRGTDGVRIQKGVCLFDFLSRIPHFARWLELTHLEQRDVEPGDVLIAEERNSDMRLERPNLFETWDSQISERLESQTIEELVANHSDQPVYVWDKYLFYQNVDVLPLRSAILCTIGAAAAQGAAITAQEMAKLYEVEHDDVKSIVHDVLMPIGCPLTTVDNAYTLDQDLRFTMSQPYVAGETLQAVINDRFTFEGENVATELATAIEQHSHPFTYPGIDSVNFDIEVVSDIETQPIYQFGDGAIGESAIYALQAQTQQKTRVTVPVGLPDQNKSLLTSIRETLETVEEGSADSTDDRLQRHLRSRYEFLGALPMLKPPSYESLTPLANRFLDTSPSDRRNFLQSIEFMCNPLLQSTLVLVDMVDVAQRSDQWITSIRGSDIQFGQLLTKVLNQQGYELVTNQDYSQRGTAIIEFAMELRMIEVDSRTHNLALQNQFGKNLRSGELGIFSYYNDVEDVVRDSLREVVEA